MTTEKPRFGRGPLARQIQRRIAPVPLDTAMKGLPTAPPGATVGNIGEFGWSVKNRDLPTPFAAVSPSALEHNARVMAEYCARHGVSLAPHGKTTMAPQLIDLQLAHGAWAVTAATVVQTRLLVDFGVDRVLLANEVTDPAGIDELGRLLAAHESTEMFVLVDSVHGVRLIDEVFRALDLTRPVAALVELGIPGGRAGARTIDGVVDVARAVYQAATLRLAGVEGYEGVVVGAESMMLDAVAEYLDLMVAALDRIGNEGLLETTEPILSAGGSVFFDLVVDRFAAHGPGVRVVLRSGCYLAHDHGKYMQKSPLDGRSRGGPRLRPAVVVWSSVVSAPEPGLVVLDAGRRDVSFDAGLPIVVNMLRRGEDEILDAGGGFDVLRLMDQHCIVRVDADVAVSEGDQVALGVSHPCTTFDKWRIMLVVDDNGVVIDAVLTFF